MSVCRAIVTSLWKTRFESQPRIFVVDDELDIAKLLVVVLQMNLFDAIPCPDPLEALEAAFRVRPVSFGAACFCGRTERLDLGC